MAALTALKIGMIGVGMVGGPLSYLWSQAGHQVFVSSRHPENLTAPPGGQKGRVIDAVNFADVILLAIPFSKVPYLSDEVKAAMAGKVVLDATNAWKGREGPAAAEAHASGLGSGVWVAGHLPKTAKVVKAFNTWPFFQYQRYAALPPGQVPGVPLAGDDAEAVRVAARLVKDARMEPVVVDGGLKATVQFDAEGPLGPPCLLTADQMTAALGAQQQDEL